MMNEQNAIEQVHVEIPKFVATVNGQPFKFIMTGITAYGGGPIEIRVELTGVPDRG